MKECKKLGKLLFGDELYINQKIGKRGKGQPKKTINVRLDKEQHTELSKFLDLYGIEKANFLRHCITKGLLDFIKTVKEHTKQNNQ